MRVKALIKFIKENQSQFPQSQAPLQEQLLELLGIANAAGLYDAADVIQKMVQPSGKEKQ